MVRFQVFAAGARRPSVISRTSLNFCSFPVSVNGNESTKYQRRGVLYAARRERQYPCNSLGKGGASRDLGRIAAPTCSPQ